MAQKGKIAVLSDVQRIRNALVKCDQLHRVFASQLKQMSVNDCLGPFHEGGKICRVNVIRDELKSNPGRRLQCIEACFAVAISGCKPVTTETRKYPISVIEHVCKPRAVATTERYQLLALE